MSDNLKLIPLTTNRNPLIWLNNLQIKYNNKEIFNPISFEVNDGDRIAIIGKNGIGKSSILKLLLREELQYNGNFKIINDLKISYVSQSTDNLKGKLKLFAKENNVDESIFKAMLIKMGLSQNDFDTNIQDMSEGQKKKILIAKSISEQANIYVWDEPLNYIDIITNYHHICLDFYVKIYNCFYKQNKIILFVFYLAKTYVKIQVFVTENTLKPFV